MVGAVAERSVSLVLVLGINVDGNSSSDCSNISSKRSRNDKTIYGSSILSNSSDSIHWSTTTVIRGSEEDGWLCADLHSSI